MTTLGYVSSCPHLTAPAESCSVCDDLDTMLGLWAEWMPDEVMPPEGHNPLTFDPRRQVRLIRARVEKRRRENAKRLEAYGKARS